MGTELEWKYDLPEALPDGDLLSWVPLRSRMAGTPRLYRMQTTYYDTPDRALSARGITLRRRLENNLSVICAKAPLPGAADPHARGEWELAGSDPAAALQELVRQGAPSELTELGRPVPVCGAAFVRTAVLLRFADGSAAELALDHGKLFRAARSAPLHVLELELKEGAPAESLAFLKALAERFSLEPQPKSKYARARSLCL